MTWLEKLIPSNNIIKGRKAEIPDGVWMQCPNCTKTLYKAFVEKNLYVCPECTHHMRMPARERLASFLDQGELMEMGGNIKPKDIVGFKDVKPYKERLKIAQKQTGEKDALIVLKGELYGLPIVTCAFEFSFMAGSMGSVVGARFVSAVETAIAEKCGLVCFSACGGARMQESLMSLLQMSKTSAALGRLSDLRLPYISVLTDQTFGGVSASLAMLGDVNIAEPRARIGFAGRRVIEQTVRQQLPDEFQRSEFLLEHGAIDMIVDRREMREKVASLLSKLINQPLVKR